MGIQDFGGERAQLNPSVFVSIIFLICFIASAIVKVTK